MFINAVNEVTRKNAQSYLEDKHIKKIATAYDNYVTDPEFAKVVTLKDIEENNFSLIFFMLSILITKPIQITRSLDERYESWRTYSEMMKLS